MALRSIDVLTVSVANGAVMSDVQSVCAEEPARSVRKVNQRPSGALLDGL